MSYILDALRKSDAQRRRGAAPELLAPPAAAEAARPRTLWWALAAAALLAIGVVIGALGPWQTNSAPPASIPAPAKPAPPKASPPPPASAAPAPSEPVAKPGKPQPAARPPTKSAKAPPAKAPPAEAAPEAQLVQFRDLPVAVQEEIPKSRIGVHAYSSDPKSRLVSIDDRVIHEGDEVSPGLRLERITPEGMIMTYKGYRFLRGVH